MDKLLHIDALALLLSTFVIIIMITVAHFSYRYLRGDTHIRAFYIKLSMLTCSLLLLASANHIGLLFAAWTGSNMLLVALMAHNKYWKSARASALLAARYLGTGSLAMLLAFSLLYSSTGKYTVQALLEHPIHSWQQTAALGLIIICAIIQSAALPFHRWLLSSLNSPTPVSAVMHAGLVNGGGFLLARFAPLYLSEPLMLQLLFLVGLMSAVIGTVWKLMQHDIKRMLACSTMAQMGFMLLQCGLGLFAAAIAHLAYHSFFKAYLFLASGSAAKERRQIQHTPVTTAQCMAALFCAAASVCAYLLANGKSIHVADSSIVLLVVIALASLQSAFSLLHKLTLSRIGTALCVSVALGILYGLSIHAITLWLSPMALMQPQPLTFIHGFGAFILAGSWATHLIVSQRSKRPLPSWMLKAYVTCLNHSQPHPATITTHRNHYQYL